MSDYIDVLAIDDDKFIHKIIAKTLNSESMAVRSAYSGEQGLELAQQSPPDLILLDVEMPGIDGYQTCEQLRESVITKSVPILFLSSRSSLMERLKGYQAGADDYITKPFEEDLLKARIAVLLKFKSERKRLQEKSKSAEEMAVTAMTSTSELGLAIQFLENSILYSNSADLMKGLLECTSQFDLDCIARVKEHENHSWHTISAAISPIEKEMLEMTDRNTRFIDFSQQTIVNYPMVSLFVRNMPIGDQERYGRIKDLLPILLSSANVKLGALENLRSLNQQNKDMLNIFKDIRVSLFEMGNTILENRTDAKKVTGELVQDLHGDLMRMDLDEDQEIYLLDRIDEVITEVMAKMDTGTELSNLLNFILGNIRFLVQKQTDLIDAYSSSLAKNSEESAEELDNNVELF